MKTKVYFLSICSLLFFLAACNLFKAPKNRKEAYTSILINKQYKLTIEPNNFKLSFLDSKNNTIVPSHEKSGLSIAGENIISSSKVSGNHEQKETHRYQVVTESGIKALVTITSSNQTLSIKVNLENADKKNISVHFGGMPMAHGLGDAGAYRESFNLIQNKNNVYKIINNGGSQRWTSTFAIFPKNSLAGVFFDEGQKTVTITPKEYTMEIKNKREATFYYFIGDMHSIYKNYKSIRTQKGYPTIKPKSRLFELGWESWDALGWNTNQATVQNILQKFLNNGYPIKWAITGSGFWEKGGTTTSFGKWGKKFPKPTKFKSWMHSSDIKWMIGLRTNFIPEGGPYYPSTTKRDKNLKVKTFKGNNLSILAKENNYFIKDKKGKALLLTSSIFPIVPSYLLDGNAFGAAQWYEKEYRKWNIDGIKEDTMMHLDSLTTIFNKPIVEIAKNKGLVMSRNGAFSAAGTLQRINDTGVGNLSHRIPINYLQYAASGFPNVYSDVAGVHNMKNLKDVDRSIRHTWLLSLTSGLAVGAYPSTWPIEKQKIFKKAIDFHYTITPYIYSEAIKGYHSGYPTTLTPLTIAFPKDTIVPELENFQWMLGTSILATPMLKNYKSKKMDIYLPKGIWFDYDTETKYTGPLILSEFKIPLKKTPCFVGGKGIIIERKKDFLIAKIYPIEKKRDLKFYDTKGNLRNIISVKNTNWHSITITNTTTGLKVAHFKNKNSIEFEISKGHNYKVQ